MLRADRRAVGFFASKLRLQVVDGPCPVCHACGYLGSPFINNCGFDMAGAVFAHLLGRLSPRGDNILSHIIEVDQQQFFPPDTTPEALGMSTTAFAYVPASCSASASAESPQRCRIHVMLECITVAGRRSNRRPRWASCGTRDSMPGPRATGSSCIIDLGFIIIWAFRPSLLGGMPSTHVASSVFLSAQVSRMLTDARNPTLYPIIINIMF